MKKVICLLIFYYTFTLALFSQVSFSAGVSRLREGNNPGFLSESKKQLFLNDYITAKVDYKKKWFGAFIETLYLNKSIDLHQHFEEQYGSGSSGFKTYTTDLYSKVSFSYLGLKGGVDFVCGTNMPTERINNQFYLSLFHQIDFRKQFSQTDQVQYEKYSYKPPSPNIPPVYVELPANYTPIESINFLKSYIQFGIEFRYRYYYTNIFLELSAGTALSVNHRTTLSYESREFPQEGIFNINSSLKVGYLFKKRN